MISPGTRKMALAELNLWLNKNAYSEARQVNGNLYTANSVEGIIAIMMINRESHQPNVNCVKRDKFDDHLFQAQSLKCKYLFYVMYLRGNKLQVIIPQSAVKLFFSDLTKDWYTLSMNPADFGKHRQNNIIIRKLKDGVGSSHAVDS